MTEQELISLGFEKQIEEGTTNQSYYYALDMLEGLFCFTEANDEIKNDEWIVELSFDCNPRIKFKDVKSFNELLNILNQSKILNQNEYEEHCTRCYNRELPG